MRFADFVGNARACKGLQQDVASGTLAHSYLLVGPDHVGKTTLALAFAQALNCLNPQNGDSCGECTECVHIARLSHPDVVLTQAKSGKGAADVVLEGALVSLEQAQALRKRAQMRPYQGKFKVEILAGADRMSLEAANALLKTLEEPPDDTVLILTAANLDAVLPTIRSRCRQMRLGVLYSDELEAECARRFPGLGANELQAVTSWAGGRVGLAFNLAQNPESLEQRDVLLSLCSRVLEARPLDAFRLAEELQQTAVAWSAAMGKVPKAAASTKVQRTALGQALELMLAWFNEVLRVRTGFDRRQLRFADKYTLLESLARATTISALLAVLEAVQQTRRAILANTNLQLALEALVLKISFASNTL